MRASTSANTTLDLSQKLSPMSSCSTGTFDYKNCFINHSEQMHNLWVQQFFQHNLKLELVELQYMFDSLPAMTWSKET